MFNSREIGQITSLVLPDHLESQPEHQVLNYSIENPAKLWELIRSGTNGFNSAKSGGFVVCGPEMGNLGGSPLVRIIKNGITVKLDLKKQGGSTFYNAIPTEALQVKIGAVSPNLVADGVNVYVVVDGKRIRTAYKDANGYFVYEPRGVGIFNEDDLQRHLELAARIYIAYATAYYEKSDLAIPQDDVIFRPDELETAEEISQIKRSTENGDINDMILEKVPDAQFEDVGGQDKAVRTCRRFAEQLGYPELFALSGSKTPRGILLWGPPGTGKTLLAKAIAFNADAHFIHVQAADIAGGGLYGQSEKAATAMFSQAKTLNERTGKHVVIFIDEGDLLLPKKSTDGGAGRHEATGKIVGIFAQAMDGMSSSRNITVIISTNEPGDLDPRILSRMDEVEEVPRPDAKGIEQILSIHLQKLLEKSSHTVIDEGVDLTALSLAAFEQGLSGRDIADVIGILARLRGQEQLRRINQAIRSGRIQIPGDVSEREFVTSLARRISEGNIEGIEDLSLGSIRHDEILNVINEAKSLLKSKKKTAFGFQIKKDTSV